MVILLCHLCAAPAAAVGHQHARATDSTGAKALVGAALAEAARHLGTAAELDTGAAADAAERLDDQRGDEIVLDVDGVVVVAGLGRDVAVAGGVVKRPVLGSAAAAEPEDAQK